jgi:hypothetical protein
MNLKDLIAKMDSIEEGIEVIGGPIPMPHTEQPSTVTMNVSMNGSGADGIKNLMAVLRDIENGGDAPLNSAPHHAHSQGSEEEPIMGDMIAQMTHNQEENMEEVMDDDAEMYGNSAHGNSGHHTHGVDAVTFSGDDMNRSKHSYKHNYRGGDNPMNMQESLQARLMAMYQTIKEERTEEKDDKGNVVRWKEEGEWTKKTGKEGRGKVTNMSDKARRETEKMSKKETEVAEGHSDDDEEKKIRHLMQKYGWSHHEALEYYHYEQHDPKDYEDMEESAMLALNKRLNG